MSRRRSKKQCSALAQNIAPDPLVGSRNPPHRHQARTTAHSTRHHHRMVTLAPRPPGRSATSSSQKDNATVMLGHEPIQGDSLFWRTVIQTSNAGGLDGSFRSDGFRMVCDCALAAQQATRGCAGGRPAGFNGIFWRLRTGAPWADIPGRYGPHTTCVNRFNRWRRAGVWDRLLAAVSKAYDGKIQMIDSSSIRVHQHAANGQKKRRDRVAWVARAAG